MLGDSATAFESLTGRGFVKGADDAASIKAMVRKEIFVFDANGCLLEIGGEAIELDGSAILVVINFVEQFAITIENFGGNGVTLGARKASRRGEVA